MTPKQTIADAVGLVRKQHRLALEGVIAAHMLWRPRLVSFATRPGDDVVELSDGRAFLVRTEPVERGSSVVFETTVSELT